MAFARPVAVIVLMSPLVAEQLPVQPYSTTDGLANNHVKRIRTDSRGFLWFCTDEGLSRYDGHSFTTYSTRDGLPHPWVNDLIETRDGSYWVATDGGVCRYTGKQRFRIYLPSTRPGAARVNSLLEDHDGAIWRGTYDGLYRMLRAGADDVRFIKEQIGSPDSWQASLINFVFLDHQKRLWAASQSGLYWRGKDGAWKRSYDPRSPPENFVEMLSEDREGRLWAATRTRGFCSLLAEPTPSGQVTSRCYSTADGLPSNDVRSIYQSSDNRLWIGTIGGLSEFQPGTRSQRFRTFTIANGLSGSAIYALEEDRDGNLWIGTKESGVIRLPRGGLTTYTEREGYRSGAFSSSIFETRSGELCVTAGHESTNGEGVRGVSHSAAHAAVVGTNDNPAGIGIFGKGGRLAARFEGDVEVTGDIRLVNADCAEDFDIAAAESIEPGAVMVLGEEGVLRQSEESYDKRVAGVISGAGDLKPGIVLDKKHARLNRKPLALMGKVCCKVDASYAPIHVGGLLTTSPTPGYAMKADDPLRAFGCVMGKALRSLPSGQGLIPVLVALQ